MIIDSHAHIFKEEDKENLLRSMDICSIDKAIISCLGVVLPSKDEIKEFNKSAYEFSRAHSDRIEFFCHVNPKNDDCADVIERAVEDMGAIGIKLWLACACDDEAVDIAAKKAIKYNLPILIHTFFMQSGNPPYESTAFHVRNLALRYPEAKIIMAHLGGNPYHGIRAVKDLKNVFVDYAGTFYGYSDIDYAIEHLGADRVLFGTDFPIADERFGIGKIESAKLSEADKAKIYSGNILRLIDSGYHIGDETENKNTSVDFGHIKSFEREHIDINASFGALPYFKTAHESLSDFEKSMNSYDRAAFVSSLDALFFEDAAQADEEFINSPSCENIKKVATINPTHPCALADLHRYADSICGIKIAPYLHGYSLTDERAAEFARECASCGKTLFIMSRVFDERQQYCVKSKKFDIDEAAEFAKQAAGTVVFLSLRHEEIEKLAALGLDNVYFDTSGLKGGVFSIERLVNSVGAERIMYGSMSPIYNRKSTLYIISGAQISEHKKRAILFENAENILQNTSNDKN